MALLVTSVDTVGVLPEVGSTVMKGDDVGVSVVTVITGDWVSRGGRPGVGASVVG